MPRSSVSATPAAERAVGEFLHAVAADVDDLHVGPRGPGIDGLDRALRRSSGRPRTRSRAGSRCRRRPGHHEAAGVLRLQHERAVGAVGGRHRRRRGEGSRARRPPPRRPPAPAGRPTTTAGRTAPGIVMPQDDGGGEVVPGRPVPSAPVRLVIARCSVDYIGRLTAHLPMATRLLLVKADGSVSIHADDRAYKPLNWMTPPCTLRTSWSTGRARWTVTNKAGEQLIITIDAVEHDYRTSSASTPACRRTASRRSCSGCSRCTSRRSAPAGRWSAASTRRRSARSTCSAATRPAPSSPSRSSAAARSTASSSSPATWSCSTAIRCSPRSRACSPRRRSSRRPGCSPPTAASTA